MTFESLVSGHYNGHLEGISLQSANGITIGAKVDEWQIPRMTDRLMVPVSVDSDIVSYTPYIYRKGSLHRELDRNMELINWLVLPPASIGPLPIGGVRHHMKLGILHYAATGGPDFIQCVDFEGKPYMVVRNEWINLAAFPPIYHKNIDLRYDSTRQYEDDQLEYSHFDKGLVVTKCGRYVSPSVWLNLPVFQSE